MMRRTLVPSLILLAALAFAVSSASASPRTINAPPSSAQTPVPGNYCISCHLTEDPRPGAAQDWKGSIAREINSPCPAATKVHTELYYTERMLLMIDRAEEQVGSLPEKTRIRLDNYTQRYSRMLDASVTSLDAFVSEAQTTRYQLNKGYSALNDMAESRKKRTVLASAGMVTLVVLGSLVWGLYHTRAIRSGGLKKPRAPLGWVVFVLAVLAVFALPIFRIPPVEVAAVTTAEQAAQSVLDAGDRAAAAADRSQARAWMIARLAAAWHETDPDQAQITFTESLAAIEQARANTEALWGQSLSVQEAMIGVPIDMENANLIATDLNAARARAWSLPLIAVEWNKIDPARAVRLLENERNALRSQTGIYRDMQLRSVALAWAVVQPSEPVSTAGLIQDPAIRAWTFRELAVILNAPGLFDPAAEAARKIEDPVQRARSLRELALASANRSLFEEALAALQGVTGAPLAYALSDMAAASGDGALVEQIDPAYPDAETAALLQLGEYQAAWNAALGIPDRYERGRAQAAIAGAWENAAAAAEIEIPLYRDLAMRDVIRKTGNASLTDSIQSAYYRVQALVAVGNLEPAVQAAGGLGDSFPLIELAVSLARDNPRATLDLLEKMTRETDKAVVLRTTAALTEDPSLFEQAQSMALAARVQGDALAPAQASLDLAALFWQSNPAYAQAALRQAFEAALRISTK